jgi:hypothetical protein
MTFYRYLLLVTDNYHPDTFYYITSNIINDSFHLFITVCLICLPFSLYKIQTALHLAKKGFELTVTNISVEKCYFGQKIKFEYNYDGQTYYKSKFFHSIFFPEKAPLKILIDTLNPSKFIMLKFNEKSVVSVVQDRNS